MNTEYVWWVVVLLLVGGGAIAFLALGRIPDVEDDPAVEPDPTAEASADAAEPAPSSGAATPVGQGLLVSTTVPGSDEPTSASDTP
jgi:hypothetical protein